MHIDNVYLPVHSDGETETVYGDAMLKLSERTRPVYEEDQFDHRTSLEHLFVRVAIGDYLSDDGTALCDACVLDKYCKSLRFSRICPGRLLTVYMREADVSALTQYLRAFIIIKK